MKLNKILLPLLATPLLLTGCKKDDGGDKPKPTPKDPDWTATVKRAMNEEFGFVVPYVTGAKRPTVYFEDGELTVYVSFTSYAKGKSFVETYHAILLENSFVGNYEEEVDEYEGEIYYSISGEYSHATDKSFTAFNETFETPVALDFSLMDYGDSVYFMMYANLEVEYKVTTNIAEKFANVLGSITDYVLIDCDSYKYNYSVSTYQEVDYWYLNLLIESTTTSEGFMDLLAANHFYIEEGGLFDSYYYWCLPWPEHYELYVNGYSDGETSSTISLSYGTYTAATIYDSFPLTELCTRLGFNYDSSLIPTFGSDSNYNYKVWNSSSSNYKCVDAIDPKAADPTIEKTLAELFEETLNEKGFTPVTSEGATKPSYYEKEIVENVTLRVNYNEADYYFSGYYMLVVTESTSTGE